MSTDIGAVIKPSTDVMKFIGDWPGVFISGDEAMGFVTALKFELKYLGRKNSVLEELVRILESCEVKEDV